MSMMIAPDSSLGPGLSTGMTTDRLKVILWVALSGCVHEISVQSRLKCGPQKVVLGVVATLQDSF